MKRIAAISVLICVYSVLGGETAPVPLPQPGEGATERIHRAALAWLDDYLTHNKVDQLVPIAEGITDSLIAGGNLYVAGDAAFTDEMNFRAGRFAATKVWNGERMAHNDVLIIGLLAQNDKATRSFTPGWIAPGSGRFSSALTVVVGSQQWVQISRLQALANKKKWAAGLYFADTNAPDGESLEALALDQMASIAVVTALEAEIVAAASRKGRTLSMLASIKAPGGEAFDEKIKGKAFLDEPKLEPIPAGKLGREYLTQCRKQIELFLNSQAARVRVAAKRLADCQTRGGTIWTVAEAHLHPRGAIVPAELTHLFFYGHSWDWDAPRGLQAGDTLLFIGYLDYPTDAVAASVQAGADAVVVTVDAGPALSQVTWLASSWEKWDGVVEVSGYPYKVLPSSAVVQTPQWYSLMAEAAALVNTQRKTGEH